MSKINVRNIDKVKDLSNNMVKFVDHGQALSNNVATKHKNAQKILLEKKKYIRAEEARIRKLMKNKDDTEKKKYEQEYNQLNKISKKIDRLVSKEKAIYESYQSEVRKISQRLQTSTKESSRYLNKAHDILKSYNTFNTVSRRVASYDRTVKIANYGTKLVEFSVEASADGIGPTISNYIKGKAEGELNGDLSLEPGFIKDAIMYTYSYTSTVPVVGPVVDYLMKKEADEFQERSYVEQYSTDDYENFFGM